MNFKNLLLSSATGALLLTTSAVVNFNQNAAMASWGGPTSVQNPIRPKVAKELNLTDDQKAKIKDILESSRQQIDTILTPDQKEKIKTARAEHKRPKDLNLTDDQKTQIKALRKTTRTNVLAVLTPEQKDKLQQLMKERRERRQNDGY